jgi:hypothetical protein
MAGNVSISGMTPLDSGNVTSTLLVPVVKPGVETNYHTQVGNLTIATAVPLPFVGTAPVVGWTRPSLADFPTWLNQGSATAEDGAGGLPLSITSAAEGVNTTSNVIALLQPLSVDPLYDNSRARSRHQSCDVQPCARAMAAHHPFR